MKQKTDRRAVTAKIKALRQMAGLTQDTLAESLGISRGTYANYESRSVPREELLGRLARIYKIDPRAFYAEESDTLLDMQGRLNDSAYAATREVSTLPEDEKTLLLLYRLLEKEQQEQLLQQLSESLRDGEKE